MGRGAPEGGNGREATCHEAARAASHRRPGAVLLELLLLLLLELLLLKREVVVVAKPLLHCEIGSQHEGRAARPAELQR